jgi:hypothetical protein
MGNVSHAAHGTIPACEDHASPASACLLFAPLTPCFTLLHVFTAILEVFVTVRTEMFHVVTRIALRPFHVSLLFSPLFWGGIADRPWQVARQSLAWVAGRPAGLGNSRLHF